GVGRNGDDAACGKQGEFFHGYLYQVLLVTMARAWMGWGMRSCTRSYTRRCRASAPRPANRGEAITTRKWLTPSRAPAWPACRCDSSMISRLDGSSAASRSRSRAARSPAMVLDVDIRGFPSCPATPPGRLL